MASYGTSRQNSDEFVDVMLGKLVEALHDPGGRRNFEINPMKEDETRLGRAPKCGAKTRPHARGMSRADRVDRGRCSAPRAVVAFGTAHAGKACKFHLREKR